MRLKHCIISFPIFLAVAPLPALAQLEVCREVRATTTNGSQSVTECGRAGSSGGMGWAITTLPAVERETLELSIPGYEPGDGKKHIYVLTFFTDTGVGNTNLYPDEYGAAQVSLHSMGGPEEAPAERALVISSLEVESGKMRFSMDLANVSATAFVNALYNAKRNLEGDLAMLRREPRRRPFPRGPSPRNDLVLGERRISLAGENLTLDETLDLLYEVSGCSVFLEENYLAARSCR